MFRKLICNGICMVFSFLVLNPPLLDHEPSLDLVDRAVHTKNVAGVPPAHLISVKGVLTIKGQKKEEKEETKKDYSRRVRSVSSSSLFSGPAARSRSDLAAISAIARFSCGGVVRG
jgi:hypothetical protein